MPRKKEEDTEQSEGSPVDLKQITDDLVLGRVKEYEADFEIDSLTTVDRAQIRRMAKLELAADAATNDLVSNSSLSPAQRKALSDTAKSLSAEARQLADTLGMSRQKRLTEEEAEQEALIPKLYREGREFLHQHAIAILCPHCREEKAHVEIKLGSIIYALFFEGEWEWKAKCPRCQRWYEINQHNYIDFRFDTLNNYEDKDEIVTEEEDREEEAEN